MKIFVSWSGEQARSSAELVGEWLRKLFQQSVEVFVSSKDIEKGDRWSDRLAAVLNDYNFGIVILNHINKDKPWVNFEAGALSKGVSKSRLVPLLYGLTPGDFLDSPLGQFQAVEATKQGLLDLARTINANLERPLAGSDLEESFDAWWEKKGKPICELSLPKISEGKKETNPTSRDVMARIDRLESQLSEGFARLSELAIISAESARMDQNLRNEIVHGNLTLGDLSAQKTLNRLLSDTLRAKSVTSPKFVMEQPPKSETGNKKPK